MVGQVMFGPSAGVARAVYARGVSERVDLSVSPGLIWIGGRRRGDSRADVYTLALGAKFAPLRHVAVRGSLGGGASAAGGFASGELGVIGGYENNYLVPFAKRIRLCQSALCDAQRALLP